MFSCVTDEIAAPSDATLEPYETPRTIVEASKTHAPRITVEVAKPFSAKNDFVFDLDDGGSSFSLFETEAVARKLISETIYCQSVDVTALMASKVGIVDNYSTTSLNCDKATYRMHRKDTAIKAASWPVWI
jgi:hypothetical protein